MDTLASQSSHVGELIVVDNNSTDATARVARAAGATVVFEPVNQIARSRNRGVSIASGDALVFVDADTLCSKKLLQQALDLLSSETVVGGGTVIAIDRDAGRFGTYGVWLWNWLSRRARMAAGCFVFCRRDAFDAVGGFNVKVFAGEEIYLSRRLKRWGRRHSMRFEILDVEPVITSARKLHWYSPLQIILQAALVLIPGAIYSKRLCRTWYDRSRR